MKNIPCIYLDFPIILAEISFSFLRFFIWNFTMKIPINPQFFNHPNPLTPSPQYPKINLVAKYPFWIGVKLSKFGVKGSSLGVKVSFST